MTAPVERYPFVPRDPSLGDASLTPVLPFTLSHRSDSISVDGLLDTDATVNVLPWQLCLQLGLDWDAQTTPVRLTGNLAAFEARVVVLDATIGQFRAVRLAFAWTQHEHVPLLLGLVNFFLEFDVCFFRAERAFEARLHKTTLLGGIC